MILAQRKIPSEEVGKSIIVINRMLATSPNQRLRRVGRLARLSVETSLMEKRIGVYAMVGKFPTYATKIEGKGKKGRKPIRRYG